MSHWASVEKGYTYTIYSTYCWSNQFIYILLIHHGNKMTTQSIMQQDSLIIL